MYTRATNDPTAHVGCGVQARRVRQRAAGTANASRITLAPCTWTNGSCRFDYKGAYEADRIGLVVRNLELATEELKALDIFDSITIELDKGASRPESAFCCHGQESN